MSVAKGAGPLSPSLSRTQRRPLCPRLTIRWVEYECWSKLNLEIYEKENTPVRIRRACINKHASQHGGLRGHFALRVVQKLLLLEKLDFLFPCSIPLKKKKRKQILQIPSHGCSIMIWISYFVVILKTLTVSDVTLLPWTFAHVCTGLVLALFFFSFFQCVHARLLAQCSIMCKAPHKPDQAETLGPFFYILYFLSHSPTPPSTTPTLALVSCVPYKKKREMGSYGGNYFWEPRPVIHPSTTPPSTHLHPSTPPTSTPPPNVH